MPTTRVHVMDPRGFNDAQEVGDRLKNGQPVILNLQGVDRDLQRRLIDFSSGLAYALSGTMSKAADQVFLLTPSNVEVSDEEKERLQARALPRLAPLIRPAPVMQIPCALITVYLRHPVRCARSSRGSRRPRAALATLLPAPARSHRARARAVAARDSARGHVRSVVHGAHRLHVHPARRRLLTAQRQPPGHGLVESHQSGELRVYSGPHGNHTTRAS